MRSAGLLTLVAAAGGALGAGARGWLVEAIPAHDEAALWLTLTINVLGCALLAALPAAPFVRRDRAWSVFLGTGVLGDFTTMSTAIVLPLASRSPSQALGYVTLTLVAALLAVWAVGRLVPGAGVDTLSAQENP